MALRQFQAYVDDVTTIRIVLPIHFPHHDVDFTLEAEKNIWQLEQIEAYLHKETVVFLLQSPVPIDLETDYRVVDQDRNASELGYGAIVRKPIFDATFTYEGDDLGAHYTSQQTTFTFWGPISKQVFLVLEGQPHAMNKAEKGTWKLSITGNLDGKKYHYLHSVNGKWIDVHDPYALSSEANSGQSYVINPAKFHKVTPLKETVPFSQAIIYEMSVRDFSQQKEAGFSYPGTFKGLTESPILDGQAIGFDHVKNLGVTHVQLLPVYDFGSVDEEYPQAVYNWGYDPVQYNVPEGSFSSNPHDPYARILELQEAIDTYHQAGIGVNMDVVYNHVYHAEKYAFERIVPGYFYRYEANGYRTNGTFCGNDVASERAMVRRYIKQSLRQWTTYYGFDGFRFDLMGILDTVTIQEITEELQALNPNIYLYGEGWRMGTGLPYEDLAHQYNAAQLPSVGFFNDEYRDTFKKILLNPHYLVDRHEHERVQDLLAGSRNRHFITPGQSLNYVECHDNATVFDYFHIEDPSYTTHFQKRAASLGLQLTLLAQGAVFIHSGQEFFRTKDEIDNTYNVTDAINRLDWTRAIRYREHVSFIKTLIAFRKAHPSLAQADYKTINETCRFYWLNEYVLRYSITLGEETLHFVINFSNNDFTYHREVEQEVLFNYPPLVSGKETEFMIAGQSICALTEK